MRNEAQLDFLFEIIDRFPQGASIEELLLAFDPLIPRRSLQRWTLRLVEQGRVEAVGSGRARRYVVRHRKTKNAEKVAVSIPLTSAGSEIWEKITRPIEDRPPVAYRREFLEEYIPNQTFYLPETLRLELRSLGGRNEERYPAGTYARQIFHRLLIDLSWNSSRLEGNTYSLLETERLLEKGNAAEGKDLKETQMILNHKAAIEFLILSSDYVGINRYTILNLHTLLSDNLMPDSAACGRLRTIPVGISKSVYQPPLIPQVIEECFNLLLQKASAIANPFEQAFFLMVQLPYLQAFDDVNKRTSRLAANIPLIAHNLCPLSFIDVSDELYINGLLGVYELNRVELLRDVFAWAYERSCARYSTIRQTVSEPDPFRMAYRNQIQRAIQKIVWNLLNKSEAIRSIREEALEFPPEIRSRFIQTVEQELQNLHEGNIARYQLSPNQYAQWRENWQ